MFVLTKPLKHSKQRDALINILQNTKTHPSAEWLYNEVKKEFPNVSLATIYRNLNLLLANNQIVRLDIGSGTEHYDACCNSHYHLVCEECNSITDITLPLLDDLEKNAEELNNITIKNHSLLFYGVCQNCKKSV